VQKGLTLSSREAEYVIISESLKDNTFMYFLLCDIGINVELPVVVKMVKIGAMFMPQFFYVKVFKRAQLKLNLLDHVKFASAL
jgi:hypothetical protein